MLKSWIFAILIVIFNIDFYYLFPLHVLFDTCLNRILIYTVMFSISFSICVSRLYLYLICFLYPYIVCKTWSFLLFFLRRYLYFFLPKLYHFMIDLSLSVFICLLSCFDCRIVYVLLYLSLVYGGEICCKYNILLCRY